MSYPARLRSAAVCTASLACLMILCPPASAQEEIFSDGFEDGTFSAWAAAVGLPEATPFRFDDLDLRDPHVFADVPVFGCQDFTDDPIAGGLIPSLNDQLETSIVDDGDGDGFLDTSILLLLRPLDTSGPGHALETRRGLCTAPLATTTCAPDPATPAQYASYAALQSGFCLEPLPGTTSGYIPGIDLPVAVCFVTTPLDLVIGYDGFEIPLQSATLAATFVGEPPDDLATGLIMGFLSEADADAILIPPEIPVVGGQPITILLPGGSGSCAGHDDRDVLDSTTGWWFYFNFSAEVVPYSGR